MLRHLNMTCVWSLWAALSLMPAALAWGQAPVMVQVETNVADGALYADSTWLGAIRQGVYAVPAGTSELRLLLAEVDTWTVAPVTATLDAAPGDTVQVTLNAPYYYKVESVPFEAPVYLEGPDGRTLLGHTPLLYTSETPLEGELVIDRKEYVTHRFEPGTKIWNRHVMMLEPARRAEPMVRASEVAWSPPPKRRRWIDVTAGAVAVAAGAYSVHQKFKADDLFDQYQETRDPALRDEIRAYDTRALVGLGVMQAGVGVIAVRFILR